MDTRMQWNEWISKNSLEEVLLSVAPKAAEKVEKYVKKILASTSPIKFASTKGNKECIKELYLDTVAEFFERFRNAKTWGLTYEFGGITFLWNSESANVWNARRYGSVINPFYDWISVELEQEVIPFWNYPDQLIRKYPNEFRTVELEVDRICQEHFTEERVRELLDMNHSLLYSRKTSFVKLNGRSVKTTTLIVDGIDNMEKASINTRMVENYTKSCKKFAAESRGWIDIEQIDFCSTDGAGDWYESSDNNKGGFDVKWAFHKSAKEIEKQARFELEEQVKDMLFYLDSDDGSVSRFVQEELDYLL